MKHLLMIAAVTGIALFVGGQAQADHRYNDCYRGPSVYNYGSHYSTPYGGGYLNRNYTYGQSYYYPSHGIHHHHNYPAYPSHPSCNRGYGHGSQFGVYTPNFSLQLR
ncbi:MAG: hypothetical protein KDA80_00350 [Planctomycetaceae bacterium]|nr:hypothetical protein [Planctomycetaceae bacterium]